MDNDDTPDRPYTVGYGKPPAATRFKPGRSGNPRGRPRRKTTPDPPRLNEERMKTIILEEAYRPVSVRDGDRQVEIPVIQAVLRSLAVSAAKGHRLSQRLFTDLVTGVERANKTLHDEWLEVATIYKTNWERAIARARAEGRPEPTPLPHPDDIVINMQTGEVEIRGPMTPEEKAKWDMMRARRDEYRAEIEENRQLLRDQPDYAHRELIEDDIRQGEKIVAIIEKVVGKK